MVRHSDTWVFNISPDNWDHCANGPTEAEIHGEDNIGNPWHGSRQQSKPDLKPGDLVIALVTSANGTNDNFGVKGLWRFEETRQIASQDEVPWTDADYEWAIYCRPLLRELDTVFTEDFGTDPAFSSNTLQGSIKSLESADKAEYLDTIRDHVDLPTDVATTVEEAAAAASASVQLSLDSMNEDSEPSMWIEKTDATSNEYKQSGEYALGNVIFSPPFAENGADVYPTMRDCEVGDVVLHLNQETGQIVGASRIEEKTSDFEGFPELGWTAEQREEGGFLHHLTDFEEFDDPVDFYAVLDTPAYEDTLDRLREEHTYMPYTKRLSLTQGSYLSRCPPLFGSLLANDHQELTAYLSDAGITLPAPPTEKTEDEDDTDIETSPVDYDGIGEATEYVIKAIGEATATEILAGYGDEQILQWSTALQGFNPDSFVAPDVHRSLQELKAAVTDHRSRLVELAQTHDVAGLDQMTPWQVVFLAVLRYRQQSLIAEGRFDGVPNANQPKLNSILRDAYHRIETVDHPLLQKALADEVSIHKFTAPADFWLPVFKYRALGFGAPTDEETLEAITPGDVVLLHAGGEPTRGDITQPSGYVIGAAIVGRQFESDEQWWYEAYTGDRSYPTRMAFDRLFVTPGVSELTEIPPMTPETSADRIQSAVQQLTETAVPISDVNSRCDVYTDSEFPARTPVVTFESGSVGRGEAILDLLADRVTEVSPIAIDQEFTGTIPPEAFESLYFPEDQGVTPASELAGQVTAALRAGKHIIFTGPPGTGKTKLAEQVVSHLVAAYPHLYTGQKVTTATADWSTFDTIGGYMPDPEADRDTLDFHPGVLLNRFKQLTTGRQANEPTVIDELNRANIDKAFGQLFTTLSGQSVTLPYRVSEAPETEIEIATADTLRSPASPAQFVVPTSWRLFGTMNTFDKTSLYEMSYAFMRRFSMIRVGVPEIPEEGPSQEELLSNYTDSHVWDIDVSPSVLREVATIWRATNTAVDNRAIGPAIVEDMLRYITAHDNSSELEARLTEAVISYIFPQLEGVPERGEIVSQIASQGGVSVPKLTRAAHDMLNPSDLEIE